jgi:hypothetical protein
MKSGGGEGGGCGGRVCGGVGWGGGGLVCARESVKAVEDRPCCLIGLRVFGVTGWRGFVVWPTPTVVCR